MRNTIRERDFLLKRASLTQNPDDWKAFKRKRNSTNKLKNSLKQTFYHDSFQESKDNPEELWKKVNQLIPDKSKFNISEIHNETSSVISDKKGEQNKRIFCQYRFKASIKISS